jgi:hypothetical protein
MPRRSVQVRQWLGLAIVLVETTGEGSAESQAGIGSIFIHDIGRKTLIDQPIV